MAAPKTKKYKLAISDVVQVLVTGYTPDNAGGERLFSIKLQCDRLDAPAFDRITKGKKTIDEILKQVSKGWAEQDLVIDEAGLPAEFNADSFQALLDFPGFSGIAYTKYLKAIGAHEKN